MQDRHTLKTGASVLIIEDNPDDFEACTLALREDGRFPNEIIRCENGEDALRYLAEADGAVHPRPGIVLLDLNLPGLDGRDVLKQIKSSPATATLPVVVMTGSSDRKDIDSCYAAGANSYLVKPGNLDAFTKAICRIRNYWFDLIALPAR